MSLTDVNVTTTDQETDLSAWRPGQAFSYDTAKEMMYRDPYGSLLCFEIPLQAIGDGFDIIDPETDEPVEENEEIWEILKIPWEKVAEEGVGLERGLGQSFLVIFKSDNPERNGEPFLVVFEPNWIDSDNLEFFNDESIKKIKFNWPQFDGKDKPITIEGKEDLKNLYWNIHRVKDRFWKAASYLEPVWDELIGLRLIRTGATLFAVRVGAGLKIIKIPEGTAPDVVADMKTAAKSLDSFNGFFLVPIGEAEIEIATGQGMIDYTILKQVLLESLAAKTKYPLAAFKGIEMERQGGEFNQERVNEAKKDIRRDYEPIARWLVERYQVYHQWTLPEKFLIRFKPVEELGTREQAELDLINAQRYQVLINAGVISRDEAREAEGYTGTAPEPPAQFSFNIQDKQPPKEGEEITN